MLEQKKGHIVGIASNFGLLGRTQFTDYTATKFGIVGLLEVGYSVFLNVYLKLIILLFHL